MIAIGCDHGGYGLKLEIIKYLEKNGLSQLRIAETEKYAHVTFVLN